MNDIRTIVTEALATGGKGAVRVAVNRLLGEDVKTGQTVAVVDDPISGFTGAKGRVASISDTNSGFAEVELANGTRIQMQTSLLVPVGA